MDGISLVFVICGAVILLPLSIMVVALAWVHYPRGIINAIREKRKRNIKNK